MMKRLDREEKGHFITYIHIIKIKLEFNNKRNHRNYSNTWRLNNTLLNDQWVTAEVRKEIKNFPESYENEYNVPGSVGHSKGCAKRKVCT
jgi:hypothetical protein